MNRMQKLLLLLLLLPFCGVAQTHRFIYAYRSVPDSTKPDSIITENTRLEIFQNHSEFLSYVVAKKDSALASNGEQGSIQLPDGAFKNKVYKSKELTYTIEFIGIQPYKVIRNVNLSWQLSSKTKKIQGYDCQMATTDFGGRRWEAWFTTEIPIPQGPYLFGGLPGLIVEINDLKNQHSFLLVANYKTKNTKTNLVDQPYFTPIKVSETQFNKKWEEYRRNPIGGTEQFMQMNPGLLSGESRDQYGNKTDMTQQKKDEQQYARKQILKNNNFLDLSLYK